MKSRFFSGLCTGTAFRWRNAAAALALCAVLAVTPQISASAAQDADLYGADVGASESGADTQDGDFSGEAWQGGDIPQDGGGAADDTMPLIGEYDVETGFYRYRVGVDREIWCSALLYSGGVEVNSLWIGTEAEDIDITVTGSSGVINLEQTIVITEVGTYAVDICYSPESGSGASWRYIINVVAETETAPDITGRLDTVPDGGERCYSFGTLGSVRTNVLDGETVSFPVKLLADDNISCTVTRDGSSYALPADGIIEENGAYDVKLAAVYSDGSIETRSFCFSVYMGATNRVGIYVPPRGCVITKVTLDGEDYPFTAQSCRFTDDGAYSVSYEGQDLNRTVTLIRDAVPPVLYFNGTCALEFDEIVEITCDSECDIVMQKQGFSFEGSGLIQSSGIYIITATDIAGNKAVYRVVVRLRDFDGLLLSAVIIAALAVAGVVYVVVMKKRGIKIR